MKNLCIIPARSGSKGLPDKNIKYLYGKPLIAYTIEAAQKSGIFDEIMVSTDSQKYADISLKFGASVPFLRPNDLSSDKASSWSVVKHVVEQYASKGVEFDNIVLLQPTSPLRGADDIKKAFDYFVSKKANYVASVCEMEHSPLWANVLPEDCSLSNFINANNAARRQSLQTFYRLNGAIYIINREFLLNNDNFFVDNSYAYIMDKRKSVDIDDEYDFFMAECIMKKFGGNIDEIL